MSIAIVSAVFGFAACCLAVWTQIRLVNVRRSARAHAAGLQQTLDFHDALLAAGEERVTVLGDGESFSVTGAHAWFHDAMAGPEAKVLAAHVDKLIKNRIAFRVVAHNRAGDAIAVRGACVGGKPVLYVKWLGAEDPGIDFRAALDCVAVPVWIRGADLSLRWANRAYLADTGAAELRGAIAVNATLDRSEPELAASARDGQGLIEATRFVIVEGRRRALALKLSALPDGSVAGTALDMTELTQAEARLQLAADAAEDMLDGMPLAVAVFDKDGLLESYNTAYAGTWNLPEQWLDGRPAFGTILDRLRETRRIPEQQNYPAWKAEQSAQFEKAERTHEDIWHLPDGRSLRIVMRPHLLGGVAILCQDITEMLRLEASLKLLTQVQRATLDTVEDGIAIFGPDGRLVLHNTVFARQWLLAESELADNPPLARVASLAEQRLGPDGLWRIVAAGVTSDEPERCNEWGKATRTDGRIVALAMTRLPNGATAVTFSDLTDVERFHEDSQGASHAVA